MSRYLGRWVGVLCLWSVWAPTALAEKDSVTVRMDNDVVFGTDRQYTGGFKLFFTDGDYQVVDFMVAPLAWFFKRQNPDKINLWQTDQIELSSEVYTLQKKSSNGNEPIGNTAWTNIAFRRFYKFDSHHYTLDVRIGWIGPSSGGEEIQNTIHEVIGNQNGHGWDRQPPDQPTLQIAGENQNVVLQSEDQRFNLYRSLAVELGSPRTALSAGLGTFYAVNAEPVFSFTQLNHLSNDQHDWGWFVFANYTAAYEIYSVFQDGRLGADDPFTLEAASELVAEFQYGGGVVYDEVSVTFSGTSMNQYYKNQTEDIFRFASLTVTFPF